jgi:hypothetical protein
LALVALNALVTLIAIHIRECFFFIPSLIVLSSVYPIFLFGKAMMKVPVEKLSSAIYNYDPQSDGNDLDITHQELAIYYHSSQRVVKELDWIIGTPLVFGIILGFSLYAMFADVPYSFKFYGLYMIS